MTKKLLLLTLITVFAVSVFARQPVGIRRVSPAYSKMPASRESSKVMAFFRAVKNSRAQLGLNEKQNAELDKILREVDNYTKNLKKQPESNYFETNFVYDSFDPFKMDSEKIRRQEEARKFYLSKMKAIHDLLTKEQRRKLMTYMKTKRMTLKERKNKKIQDKTKWMKEKKDKKFPKKY